MKRSFRRQYGKAGESVMNIDCMDGDQACMAEVADTGNFPHATWICATWSIKLGYFENIFIY